MCVHVERDAESWFVGAGPGAAGTPPTCSPRLALVPVRRRHCPSEAFSEQALVCLEPPGAWHPFQWKVCPFPRSENRMDHVAAASVQQPLSEQVPSGKVTVSLGCLSM